MASAVAAAALGAVAAAAACGAPPRDAEGEGVAGRDSGAARAEAADSLAASMPGAPGDPAAPPRAEVTAPADSARPPLRSYPLLLVNPHPVEARVFASAGAERVALDTLAAGDSARVDVRVRATTLSLEAEDPAGRPLGRAELPLRPGTLHRWEVPGRTPRSTEREAATPGGAGRVVRARTPDYPRATPHAGSGAATRRGTAARHENAFREGLDGA